MPLWGDKNNANNAPKYDVTAHGDTGIEQYGNTIFFVTGSEGYGIPPGWARKIVGTGGRVGRISWEPLVILPSVANTSGNTSPSTAGQPTGLLLTITKAS